MSAGLAFVGDKCKSLTRVITIRVCHFSKLVVASLVNASFDPMISHNEGQAKLLDNAYLAGHCQLHTCVVY
jgi:hypothetical protein